MRPAPRIIPLLLVLSTPAFAARSASDLNEICDQALSAGDVQLGALCKAAVRNIVSYNMNENNSRLWAPVTAICGHSCMRSVAGLPFTGDLCAGTKIQSAFNDAGTAQTMQSQFSQLIGPRPQQGAGADPCSATVNAGQNTYGAHKSSKEDLDAASASVDAVLKAADGMAPHTAGAGVPEKNGLLELADAIRDVPASCMRVLEKPVAKDRIDCALATDPKMPGFIKDPRFLAEFKETTGASLDSVVNEPATAVAGGMVPTMLQNAAGALKGKMSLAQFMKTATGLSKLVSDTLPTADDRSRLLSDLLPASLRGFVSSPVETKLAAKGAEPVFEGKGVRTANSHGDPASAEMLTGRAPERSPAEDDETIFVKVSRCYQRVSNRLTEVF